MKKRQIFDTSPSFVYKDSRKRYIRISIKKPTPFRGNRLS
jgi:hypothetical protein